MASDMSELQLDCESSDSDGPLGPKLTAILRKNMKMKKHSLAAPDDAPTGGAPEMKKQKLAAPVDAPDFSTEHDP